MNKVFRIGFSVAEFLEDGFYDVCSGSEVSYNKEKLLIILKQQYKKVKNWIEENINHEEQK